MANTAVVYGRVYDDQILTFEPSGGLMYSALVMRDRQTNSYWSIMTGEAVGGRKKGTKLRELPVGEKVQWKEWIARHPNTLVLSVDGAEHIRSNPYMNYFHSNSGFRRMRAADGRLRTKTSIFAFFLDEHPYAIPHESVTGGKVFTAGQTQILLYRPPGAEIFYSTLAYRSTGKGFGQADGKWIDIASGCVLNPATGAFQGGDADCPPRLSGFDTFWYTWSLSNPKTEVLR